MLTFHSIKKIYEAIKKRWEAWKKLQSRSKLLVIQSTNCLKKLWLDTEKSSWKCKVFKKTSSWRFSFTKVPLYIYKNMHNTRLWNRTENKAFIKCEGDDQYCTLHTDKQCAQQVN